MKHRYTPSVLTALIAVIFSVFSYTHTSAQPYGSVSFDVFYDELSPYGYWDRDPNYGDIWFPRVEQNFRPYGTNGYWTMTEYGNTWVSNYDWGWAPFHYGRWVYTPHNRWGWIPGYEWGPAWVEWRTGGDYYGWAPMVPTVGVSVNIGIPLNLWIFLPARRIYDPYINRHWSYGNRSIYNRTTVIHNTYIVNNNHYYGGPGRRDIERHIGRSVTVRNIRTTDRPGRSQVDRRSVSLYRPDRNSSRTDSRSQLRENNSRDNNNAGRNTRPQATESRRNERPVGNTPNRSDRNTNENRTPRSSDATRRERQVLHIPSENNNRSTNARGTSNVERATRSSERNTAPRRQEPTAQQSRESSRPTRQPERSNRAPQRQSAPSQQRPSAPSQQRQTAPSQRVYQTSSPNRPAPQQQQRASRVERSSQAPARAQAPSNNGRERGHSSGRGSR